MPEAWEDREPVLPVCRSAAFGEAAGENRYRKELRNNYADPLLLFFFLQVFFYLLFYFLGIYFLFNHIHSSVNC